MNTIGLKTSLVLKLLVVVFLAVFAIQGQSNTSAPTDVECVQAWTSSSASSSCGEDNSTYYLMPKAVSASVDTSKYDVTASNGECRVVVDCVKSDTSVPVVENDYSGTTSEVKSLSNCDGSLTEGNC